MAVDSLRSKFVFVFLEYLRLVAQIQPNHLINITL